MRSSLEAPIIMLVTAADPAVAAGGQLLARIDAWVGAGVDLVQIRETSLTDRQLFDLVRSTVLRVARTPARVVVNDRPDIAVVAGAHGVHLKDDRLSASAIRALGPRGWLVGRSVHDVAGARRAAAAGGVDYLLAGTVQPTPSKPGRRTLGLTGLQKVARSVALPVVAIGGLHADDAPAVSRVGAAGLAGIRLFHDGEPLTAAVRSDRIADMRQAFKVACR